MKKSLSFKITLIALVSMLFAIAGGLTATYFVASHLVSSSGQSSLALDSQRKSHQLDVSFLAAESVVKEVGAVADSLIDEDLIAAGGEALSNTLESIREISEKQSSSAEFVCAYWLVCNPELTGQSFSDDEGVGFFFVKEKGGDSFVHHEVTNVSRYTAENRENVVWYYDVALAGTPLWLAPYYNANIDQNLVTYAVPFYSEEPSHVLLGIVGLDLQFDEIVKAAEKDPAYKSASTYLIGNGDEILYHSDLDCFPNGRYQAPGKRLGDLMRLNSERSINSDLSLSVYTNAKNEERTACMMSLANGMRLGQSVISSELYSNYGLLLTIPAIVYLGIAILVAVFLFIITRRFLKPVKDLNASIAEIKAGDLSVSIPKGGDDEIGELTDSFSSMLEALRSERSAMSALAYQDGLTGVKNTAAYETKIAELNKAIEEGRAKFALVMADVNNLKGINDTMGHSKGDEAIRYACLRLCRAFAHSPVYRIGGDEFVAILEGEDYESRHEIIKTLFGKDASSSFHGFGFAVGMETFDELCDSDFASVFKRADEKMYANKKKGKAGLKRKAKSAEEE